jgi:hypothetical protein
MFYTIEILRHVLNGQIGEAIELTHQLFPGILEKNKNLLFALKVRQFIEMINGVDNDSSTVKHALSTLKSCDILCSDNKKSLFDKTNHSHAQEAISQSRSQNNETSNSNIIANVDLVTSKQQEPLINSSTLSDVLNSNGFSSMDVDICSKHLENNCILKNKFIFL